MDSQVEVPRSFSFHFGLIHPVVYIVKNPNLSIDPCDFFL
jgi:hypothetical protein